MTEEITHTITTRVDGGTTAVLVEPKIVSYTRDHVNGKTRTFHTKDIANTLHAAQFESTSQYVINGAPLHPDSHKHEFRSEWQGCRIRKLTPRECFRLMDVRDADIDKIQAAGISKTQQYKMAGNSIVVNVLYHIFRKMFVETQSETTQPTLF